MCERERDRDRDTERDRDRERGFCSKDYGGGQVLRSAG